MEPLNVVAAISLNARKNPRKLALVDNSRALCYDDLCRRATAIASSLQSLGLRRGDRVILAVGNRCEHVEALIAVAMLGAIPVPIDVLSRSEFARICDLVAPTAAIVEQRFIDASETSGSVRLSPLPSIVIGPDGDYEALVAAHRGRAIDVPELSLRDPFLFMPTSGTTGVPKCCVISHGAYAMRCIVKSIEGSVRTTDKHLSILPICFNAGRGAALAHLYFGATTFLLDDFDPDKVARVVLDECITTLMVVPRICARLLEGEASRDAYASLRRVSCTGGLIPIEVKRQFMESICGKLHNSYGSTDAGPIAALAPEDLIIRHGSAGLLNWGVELVAMNDEGSILPVGQEGELACRSPYVIDGYFGNESQGCSSGWLMTGDIGVLDDDGYLYLRSRRKEIIKSGGTTIYPSEVEESLRFHASVAEASVFGVPSTEWGEAVIAVVVLKASQRATGDELIAFCKTHLAPYKAPKRVFFLDKLPYTAMGKVDKKGLAVLVERGSFVVSPT
jgi:acyl-CoA synthetase (AMP-forming)/AMP-acid ligase II